MKNGVIFSQFCNHCITPVFFESMNNYFRSFGDAANGYSFSNSGCAAGYDNYFMEQPHFQTGLRTLFTISPLCIFSKASCQSVIGHIPPMIGFTSSMPLDSNEITFSQTGQL